MAQITIEELMQAYTSIHNHGQYSFLDGYNPTKRFVARAKELGMTALALTDHNHLGGCLEFQQECKKQGIKALLGFEGYWTWDTNFASLPVDERNQIAIDKARAAGVLPEEEPEEINPKTGKPKKAKKLKKSDIKDIIAPYEYDMSQYHYILIAMNQTGWKNLVKLQSEAADKCTYNGRFLCDDEILAKYNEGLIFSTACIGNAAAELINEDKLEEAKEQIVKWHNIFGDRMFLEIQPLNIEKQWRVNLAYMAWAQELDIKIIATNDVHWTTKEDYDDHDTLLCIGTGKYKDEENRMRYSDDFWLKDAREMVESFEIQADSISDYFDEFDREEYIEIAMQAIANTGLIADAVEDVKLGSDKPLFPEVQVPLGLTSEKWLSSKCYQQLYKYAKVDTYAMANIHTYEARLNEELDVINGKGFAPYMLTVEEYINYANSPEADCPTAPGRGSAAGSLTLFLLGITKRIDPIKYQLLFSRFLTNDRTSPPDIDTDFEYNNRYRVIEHLEERYGKAKVAHIGTYTVMGVRSGLKDVGRVLRVDYGIMNMISKKLDEVLDKPQPKFKDFDALKESDNPQERRRWVEFNELEEANKELFRLARAFEGNPRNMGVHASGILVTPMAVSDLFPTRKAKDGTTVTLYTGTQLEELNAIKFDILGLKTISVIKQALNHINPELSFEDLYNMVDVDDPKIFEMVCNKETDGLFQIESDMFKGMISDIKPDSLNDIIAITSLGRPGPLKAGMPADYAKRKNGLEDAVEPLRGTWEIVADTFGCICYQEQIMKISVVAAGFNSNQSDSIVRKVFAKKKKDQMEMLRRMFFYGKVNAEGPDGWEEDADAPWYDLKAKYGAAIKGACNNGYTVAEITKFWTNIEGFADYLFNKSHAACYSYITALTAFLKRYYPTQFMASLLTMEDTNDGKERYINVAEKMNIKVSTPDVNKSGVSFTPDGNTILYGIGSIKGVGEASVPQLIANQPYQSLEDIMEKVEKKAFNKTVGMSLIKSGAFDFISKNRYELMNQFMTLRKDKDDQYVEEMYDESVCMEMERDVLGTPITYKPWWNNVEPNKKLSAMAELVKVEERPDKNGNMMGFITLKINGCQIKGLVFASKYCKIVDMFDMDRHTEIIIEGKKDDKGTLLINNAHKSTANVKFIDPTTNVAVMPKREESEIDDRIARLLA
jgi:DNA polymerase-3 subunit alpha